MTLHEGSAVFATGAMRALARVLLPLLASGPLGIALSGGLDSRFLARAARLLAAAEALPAPIPLHVFGPHVPSGDTRWAERWAGLEGLSLLRVRVDPLALPEVARNGRDRCYFCKKALFLAMRAALEQACGRQGAILCDGSNASDHAGYRPGLKALRELGVRSPLDEAGFAKDDIRRCAADIGLALPNQASRPCLLTRFPYGLRPDHASLAALEEDERRAQLFLSERLPAVPDFRVRMTEQGRLLQIGPCPADVLEELMAMLGLPLSAAMQMDAPSGYFDRQLGLHGGAQ